MNIYEALSNIQNELKAPKNQYNSFGNYKYRNAEDILEAAKPICKKHGTTLVVSDRLIIVGERYYIEATAKLYTFDGTFVEATALARETENKKGMDSAQVTGSTSSYARKYALNGLFNIDDTKDDDAGLTPDEPKKEKKHSSYGDMNEEQALLKATEDAKAKLIVALEKPENISYKDETIKNVLKIVGFKTWEEITFKGNLDYNKLTKIVKQELQTIKDIERAGI